MNTGKNGLSRRLQAVADLVSPGKRVCDVGCDHGYVSIYLIESGRADAVLAMVSIGDLWKEPGSMWRSMALPVT